MEKQPIDRWTNISIHALREEGDLSKCPDVVSLGFLSTPSARRATRQGGRFAHQCQHFYPRPPRGGRPILPMTESRLWLFLSTPSARRATQLHALSAVVVIISIHALREEGDNAGVCHKAQGQDFYPRPPRGGRLPRHPDHRQGCAISIHALREEGDPIL